MVLLFAIGCRVNRLTQKAAAVKFIAEQPTAERKAEA